MEITRIPGPSPGALGNNKYVFAIATTGSSFGTPGSTQVTDANGAGISGTFTTSSSSFPSGNGLAGSTFDFFFNVLPGDGNQSGAINTVDTAQAKPFNNDHETSTGYNPYVDYKGAGIDSAADIAFDASHNNVHNSNLTPPTAPSASQQVETTGLTALALAVQETGSPQTSGSPTSTAGNVVPASTTPVGTTSPAATSASPGSTGSESNGSSPTTSATSDRDHTHHRFAASERFAAADMVVANFDLADLYA